jgi:hypothetical protein
MEFKEQNLVSKDIENELKEKLNVHLFSIEFSEEDNLKLSGWRDGIEKYGQELWQIYHWIVYAQDGHTHGIYRLKDWLESMNVPDNTNGTHWPYKLEKDV